MIGIDPHKASHTATVIDSSEKVLDKVRLRANTGQLEQLLGWAQSWPERTWAIENATGLGLLLAQQLLRVGERVLDVPPKLAAKARLLSDEAVNKNDPNDSRSVAVAGLRSAKVRPAVVEDYSAVMGMWSDRYLELAAARTQVVCRLHAVLCELIPGGFPGELRASAAAKVLESIEPATAPDHARLLLAWQLHDDLVRIDQQRKDTKKHMAVAVKASGTTMTEVYGVGEFVACAVAGHVGDISRFDSRAAFAAYNGTAPVEVSSGEKKVYRLSRRGNRRLNHAIHMAAVTQIRFAGTPGRIYFERKRAEGKTGKEALRALKRRISDLIYARMVADAKAAGTWKKGPGGQPGNVTESSATGSHPEKPALRKSHSRTDLNTTTSPSRPPKRKTPCVA
ncbi:MAG TPA: IS110 family transposase [Acidimicrobiales bacterium]|nr:IS110 family transposase [Acidimicrobiales bacterium]